MSCPECVSGHTHDGSPLGSTREIYELDTYVAQPANGVAPKGILIIITDAFGYSFVNVRLLADHYAASGGYLVYIPDFMKGRCLSPESLHAGRVCVYRASDSQAMQCPWT